MKPEENNNRWLNPEGQEKKAWRELRTKLIIPVLGFLIFILAAALALWAIISVIRYALGLGC